MTGPTDRQLCFCLGEMSKTAFLVNGVSFAMRSQGRVSVWVSDGTPDVVKEFLAELRQALHLTQPCRFFSHRSDEIIELE